MFVSEDVEPTIKNGLYLEVQSAILDLGLGSFIFYFPPCKSQTPGFIFHIEQIRGSINTQALI